MNYISSIANYIFGETIDAQNILEYQNFNGMHMILDTSLICKFSNGTIMQLDTDKLQFYKNIFYYVQNNRLYISGISRYDISVVSAKILNNKILCTGANGNLLKINSENSIESCELNSQLKDAIQYRDSIILLLDNGNVAIWKENSSLIYNAKLQNIKKMVKVNKIMYFLDCNGALYYWYISDCNSTLEPINTGRRSPIMDIANHKFDILIILYCDLRLYNYDIRDLNLVAVDVNSIAEYNGKVVLIGENCYIYGDHLQQLRTSEEICKVATRNKVIFLLGKSGTIYLHGKFANKKFDMATIVCNCDFSRNLFC